MYSGVLVDTREYQLKSKLLVRPVGMVYLIRRYCSGKPRIHVSFYIFGFLWVFHECIGYLLLVCCLKHLFLKKNLVFGL